MTPPTDPFGTEPSVFPPAANSPFPDLAASTSSGATTPHEPTRRRLGCVIGSVAGVFFVLIGAIALTAMLTAIWPGVYKFTAPIFCPDGYDDVLVVRDTYSVQPGETTTTFTNYCVNERGESVDVGVFRPIAVVFGGLILVLLVVFVLVSLLIGVRIRRRAATRGPAG